MVDSLIFGKIQLIIPNLWEEVVAKAHNQQLKGIYQGIGLAFIVYLTQFIWWAALNIINIYVGVDKYLKISCGKIAPYIKVTNYNCSQKC